MVLPVLRLAGHQVLSGLVLVVIIVVTGNSRNDTGGQNSPGGNGNVVIVMVLAVVPHHVVNLVINPAVPVAIIVPIDVVMVTTVMMLEAFGPVIAF